MRACVRVVRANFAFKVNPPVSTLILTKNLQCICTLNSLLTVGGTLFFAIHKYLPMSVRCTLLSSSVSPFTIADSETQKYFREINFGFLSNVSSRANSSY